MNSLSNATPKQRIIAGAIAGLPAGAAHALMNEIDRRVFRYDADDMLMVTGTFMQNKPAARKVGFVIHMGLAMAFGASYAAVLHPKSNRDAMLKGIGAAIVENTILWPLVIPLDSFHPYIREDRIDSFNHPVSLLQANLRHLALGFGLGSTYPAILRRLSRR